MSQATNTRGAKKLTERSLQVHILELLSKELLKLLVSPSQAVQSRIFLHPPFHTTDHAISFYFKLITIPATKTLEGQLGVDCNRLPVGLVAKQPSRRGS